MGAVLVLFKDVDREVGCLTLLALNLVMETGCGRGELVAETSSSIYFGGWGLPEL